MMLNQSASACRHDWGTSHMNVLPQAEQIEGEILSLLLPRDSADDKGVILEVRAGTGGEEAALFAADLFNMYQRFSEQQRWKFEVRGPLTAQLPSRLLVGKGGPTSVNFQAASLNKSANSSMLKLGPPQVLEQAASDTGGFKLASASIAGKGVYGQLKFESGVHRVQRVPVTESSGRVHTSAASVAVMPQADEVRLFP